MLDEGSFGFLNLLFPGTAFSLEPFVARLFDLLSELLDEELRIVDFVLFQLLLIDIVLVIDAVPAKPI